MSSLFQGPPVDPATGRVKTKTSSTDERPTGAVAFRGLLVAGGDGTVQVLADTGQPRVFNNGLAVSRTGGLLLTSSGPVANIASGGVAVDANGAVVVVESAPDVIHQGVGLRDDGRLCVIDAGGGNLISQDPADWTAFGAVFTQGETQDGRSGVWKIADAGGFTQIYQPVTLESGESYTFTADVWPDQVGVVGQLQYQDGPWVQDNPDAVSPVVVVPSVWQTAVLNFAALGTDSNMRINSGGDAIFWVDPATLTLVKL